QKAPKRRVIVLRSPGERERYTLVFRPDRDEHHVRVANATPMIRNEGDAEAKTNEVHYSLAPETMSTDSGLPPEVAHAPDNIVLNFRARFMRAHQEGGVLDVVPRELALVRQRTTISNSQVDRFTGENEDVGVLRCQFARRHHDVERAVAEKCQQFASVRLCKA